MQIFWHGFTCVRIESSTGDKQVTLVTDPYASDSGLRFPRTLAPDVVTLSHQDKTRFPLDVFTNEPFVISDPGEYEVRGFFAYAIPTPASPAAGPSPLIYRFEVEGMSLGFLGGLSRALTEQELGRLENIDILFVPVGGGGQLTSKQAIEAINVIEPRVVIPMNYHIEGIKEKLTTVEAFCKELGVKNRQDGAKLKITKKDLPAEDLLVAVLARD